MNFTTSVALNQIALFAAQMNRLHEAKIFSNSKRIPYLWNLLVFPIIDT
jgi:hypothetical protein